ncbi:MAG: hypothetical protein Q9222_007493 [Ikaeria aurantiellina]
MSIGFSLGDLVAVGQLAWSVYKSCKEAPDSFADISQEVLSLHAVIREFGDSLATATLPASQLNGLQTVARGCRKVLSDLQTIIDRYSSLGSQSKRTWDRLAWGKENITELRSRLISNTGLLNAFISISQIRVQQRLERYLDDCQQGRREGTVISSQSLSGDDDKTWLEIRGELEDVGVTATAFNTNRTFIIQWFKDVIQTGCLTEHKHGCQQHHHGRGAMISGSLTSDDSGSDTSTGNGWLSDEAVFDAIGSDNSFEGDLPKDKQSDDMEISNETSNTQRPLSKPSRPRPEHVSREIPHVDSGVAEYIAKAHRGQNIEPRRPAKMVGDKVTTTWSIPDLFESAANGDILALKRQLTAGALVSSKDRRGRSPLHVAARKGHRTAVIQLLEAGASPEARDNKGTTALHQATYGHRSAVIRDLLTYGADIEAEEAGPYKRTPLVIAIAEGAESAAGALLENKASIDYLFHAKRTLLHVASRTMSKERTFKLLLKAGADPNARNKTGRTPLHTAVSKDNSAAARWLLKVGVDVNVQDAWKETPLHFAAQHKNAEITEMLLEHGADVNIMNNSRKKAKDIIKSRGLGDLLNP